MGHCYDMYFDKGIEGHFTLNKQLSDKQKILFNEINDNAKYSWDFDNDIIIAPYNSPPIYTYEWEECIEAIQNIVKKIIIPNNLVLNGIVAWRGENIYDSGIIEIKDNVITIEEADFKDVSHNFND